MRCSTNWSKSSRRRSFPLHVRDVAEPGEAEDRDELTVLLSELVDDLGAYLADRPGEGVRSLADVIAYEDEHRDVEQIWFGHEHFLEAMETGGRSGPQLRRGATAKPRVGGRDVPHSGHGGS